MDQVVDGLNPWGPKLGDAADVLGAPLYLTGEESLLVTVFNGLAGVTVKISGRTLPLGATRPVPFKQTFTPTSNRAASTQLIPLGDGWLLNAEVIITAGSPLMGQTFAKMSLVRGLTSVAEDLYTLAADNVTAQQTCAWPGSGVQGSLDGAGALRSVTGTDPAAGAECSDTVPTGARWQLHAWNVQLVTSAVVANRAATIVIDDGANVLYQAGDGVVQTASTTIRHVFGEGVGFWGNPNGVFLGTLPQKLQLLAGWRIRTITQAIDVGDNYGPPQLLVEEWMEAS